MTHYWIALSPIGEIAEFGCGSWQHHRWLGVEPGTQWQPLPLRDPQAHLLETYGELTGSEVDCFRTRHLGPGASSVYDIFHIWWTASGRAVKVTLYVLPTYQWDLRYRYPANPA